MRHLAWLHAVPEGKKQSRFQAYKAASGDDALQLKLPPIDGGEYLINLLYEAGLVTQGGMGGSPLTWEELTSWADRFYTKEMLSYSYDGNGVYVPVKTRASSLSDWEILTLKTLSEAYSSEYNQASDKARPAPYVHVVEDIEELDREAIANKMKALFRSFKKS